MITIFNRRTVYFGFDMKAYADMRDHLDSMNIKYKTSVKSTTGRLKRQKAMLGVKMNAEYMYQYEIWVHSDDYDRVKH